VLQEKGYDPLAYRFFCLQSHYRKPLEFSYDVLESMTGTYEKLIKRISQLSKEGEVQQDKFDEYRQKFTEALTDDVNTSMAFTVLYDVLKADMNDATKRALVDSFDEVLSLDLIKRADALSEDAAEGVDEETEKYVTEKIEERKAAKKAKDFAKADAIRDELAAKGIILEDTREGVKWHRA
jgi:cysteinyl-tRNA synthetase